MPRIPSFPLLLVALAVLADPWGLAAQASPLVVEARGGVAVPVLSFSDGERVGEGVEPGASFSVDLAVSGSSRRSWIVGFSQHRFECGDLGCAEGERYVATGMNVGLRVNLRGAGNVIPWLRLVGRSTRVELPEADRGPAATTDLGFGGEVGVGLYVGTFASLALNPGVRLTAVNSGLPGGGTLRLRYWVADLGVALAF